MLPDGIEITIKAKREWFQMLFYPVWLTFWTFAGVMALRILTHPKEENQPNWFLALWLLGWLWGEVTVLSNLLWFFAGREVIRASQGLLTWKREVLGYGLQREFSIGSVKRLRASGFFPSSSMKMQKANLKPWTPDLGTIAFDYKGETKRFGLLLPEDAAVAIVTDLKRYVADS